VSTTVTFVCGSTKSLPIVNSPGFVQFVTRIAVKIRTSDRNMKPFEYERLLLFTLPSPLLFINISVYAKEY
jgi:hypothetical protein